MVFASGSTANCASNTRRSIALSLFYEDVSCGNSAESLLWRVPRPTLVFNIALLSARSDWMNLADDETGHTFSRNCFSQVFVPWKPCKTTHGGTSLVESHWARTPLALQYGVSPVQSATQWRQPSELWVGSASSPSTLLQWPKVKGGILTYKTPMDNFSKRLAWRHLGRHQVVVP